MTTAHESFSSLQMKKVAPAEVPVAADSAAKRLSKAITFRTISNQDRSDFDEKAFNDFHAYLADTYPLVHKTLKREVLGAPRRFSLLYTWGGKEPSLPPIVLMGHQDVVPVVPGTENDWEHDPFSGDIEGGYVWGRGSLDDKIMILAILEAIEMHLEKGFQPTRTVYLVFGQDEEVMGLEGVRTIVEELKSRGVNDIALVLDEGLPLAPGLFPGIPDPIALIGVAEKGYATLELKVEGPGGHSAMPPKHSNIGILAQAITRLEANPLPYRITQSVRDQFRFLGPELPPKYHELLADVAFGGEEEEEAASKRQSAPVHEDDCPTAGWGVGSSDDQFIKYMLSGAMTTAMLQTTTAVTMVNGGVKENVLAPAASALVNFRILQGETVQSVVEHVKKVVNDERVEVTVRPASCEPSPESDPYGKEYRLIEKSVRQAWGTPNLLVSPYLVIGGADAKYFAATIAKNVYRFTAVRVESAADTARWHGVNERVLVSEYARSIVFFYTFIANTEELGEGGDGGIARTSASAE
ncbi:M20 family peptidase [Streptomyces sp. bgisy153]|uniref:M20 family peptidase n=2 Tax=unclassified Streptomyces TaxID=2593676 RepID=UPI003D731205